MNTGPFHRARTIFAAITAALGLQTLAERQMALSRVSAYRSRGKGRGAASRRYGNKAGRYTPHQGAQERLRRQVGGWARVATTKREALAWMGGVA